MNMNTSRERLDSLEHLSARVYEAIDQPVQGEPRYRKMLRLALNLLDDELNNGNSLADSGLLLLASMQEQLSRGGLSPNDSVYNSFSQYRDFSRTLPSPPVMRTTELDEIANRYADVKRGTLDLNGEAETDGRHAIHLMALAVPYALEYYPRLNPGVIAADSALHDAPELITGDVNTLGLSPEGRRKKNLADKAAMPKLQALLGPQHSAIFHAIQGCENQEKPEDGFNKTFDKLDPYFCHLNDGGLQLINLHGIHTEEAFYAKTALTTESIASYPYQFQLLNEDRAESVRRLAERTVWPN